MASSSTPPLWLVNWLAIMMGWSIGAGQSLNSAELSELAGDLVAGESLAIAGGGWRIVWFCPARGRINLSDMYTKILYDTILLYTTNLIIRI